MTHDDKEAPADQPGVAVEDEFEAMARVASAIDSLSDSAARRRVIAWASDRYGLGDARPAASVASGGGAARAGQTGAEAEYADFPELFQAAAPRDDRERLLTAAYWRQVRLKESELNADTINEILMPLGERIARVRAALPALMSGRPQLVIQVGKGKTRQSRKSFRLTTAGIAAVGNALAGGGFGAEE